MLIHEYNESPTPASGYWGDSTGKLLGSLCNQVYVKSTTSSTVFDVVITNDSGNVVRHYTDVVGQVNDLTPFPTKGVYAIEIDNATVDEAFEVYICFREN